MSNILLGKLNAGEKVLGTMFQIGSTTAVECLGVAGLDFLIVDTEHAPMDFEAIRSLILAGEKRGIAPLIRVSNISREQVLAALDMGACGVIAPGVKTPEEVQKLIGYAKYPPVGSRGFCFTRTSAFGYDGASENTEEYFLQSNQNALIIPQCETAECVQNIEAIVAIPEVDAVFIGPYDLSLALGAVGDFTCDTFVKAVSHVLSVCKQNNKFAFILSGDSVGAAKRFAMGFDGVVLSSDTVILIEAYRKMIKETLSPSIVTAPEYSHSGRDIFAGYISNSKTEGRVVGNASPQDTTNRISGIIQHNG